MSREVWLRDPTALVRAATRRAARRRPTGRRFRKAVPAWPARPSPNQYAPRGASAPDRAPLQEGRAGFAGAAVSQSVRAAPREHRGERLDENRDVEPDRPVLEVVEVEADEVVEAERDPARDLPEPGHPRQHEVALAVPVLELDVVADRQRPRPDEAHLGAQDVQHLRDLVERVLAQEGADAGRTRVVLDLEERARGLVRVLERGLARRGVDVHRAELEHPELALAEPDAAVAIEDRAGRVEFHGRGDQQPERQPGDDDQTADDEVETAL